MELPEGTRDIEVDAYVSVAPGWPVPDEGWALQGGGFYNSGVQVGNVVAVEVRANESTRIIYHPIAVDVPSDVEEASTGATVS